MQVGRELNDPLLVRAYVDNQLDTYQQLVDLGVKWGSTVAAEAGMSIQRGHLTDGLELVRILRNAVEAAGTPILFGTPVTGLVTDAARRVTGVVTRERNGATSRTRARKAVVLASGGFARDTTRLAEIDPLLADVVATSGPGHDGDALRMAIPLGAQLRDMEHVKPSFELYRHGRTSEDIVLLFLKGAVLVNKQGKRFVNEATSYKDIGMECLRQPGKVGWQIFDRKIFDSAVQEGKHTGRRSPLTIEAGKLRMFTHGDSIQELARASGLPAEDLTSTIERYNNFVDNGSDPEFGRSVLSGNYGKPVRIDAPPFYACATVSHMLSTYAGIHVYPDMRVRAISGDIPGLYAAGEAVGGFHGASYTSGTALGKALIFGRIAGKCAAAERN